MKHTLLGWNDARVHLVFYETTSADPSDIDADFVYALGELRRALHHKGNDPRWQHLGGYAPVSKTHARRRGLRCPQCRALMRPQRRACEKCQKAARLAAAVKP